MNNQKVRTTTNNDKENFERTCAAKDAQIASLTFALAEAKKLLDKISTDFNKYSNLHKLL